MPMRLRNFVDWLKDYGVTVEPASRHFAARREGYSVYPIPAHNGLKTEIPNKYLKGCCKHFEIDPSKLPI